MLTYLTVIVIVVIAIVSIDIVIWSSITANWWCKRCAVLIAWWLALNSYQQYATQQIGYLRTKKETTEALQLLGAKLHSLLSVVKDCTKNNLTTMQLS